jgi:tRNA(fMet)-specific endonuclease VapC
MIYILDTEIFTLALLPDSPEYLRLHSRAAQLNADDELVTTIITYEEQTRGWLAYAAKARGVSHQIRAYARLKRHLMNYLHWTILEFDASAGSRFDELRSRKIAIGTADLKIASIALAGVATLVTRNVADFRKVPDLLFEDWTHG